MYYLFIYLSILFALLGIFMFRKGKMLSESAEPDFYTLSRIAMSYNYAYLFFGVTIALVFCFFMGPSTEKASMCGSRASMCGLRASMCGMY